MVTCTTPPCRAAVRLNSGVRHVMNHNDSSGILENPSEWTVMRYCVDLSPETSLATSLEISLRHISGSVKTLVFSEPRFEQWGPLQIPQVAHILIKTTGERGWESIAGLEVSEILEDQATLFWASSVKAHA